MAKILSAKYSIETEKRHSYGGPTLDVTRMWYLDSTDCDGVRKILNQEFEREFHEKDVRRYQSIELKEDGTMFVYLSVMMNYDKPRHKTEMFVGKEASMMRRISERLKAL